MQDNKKNDDIEKECRELDIDTLEHVTGGSLKDVTKKSTTDMSKDTASKL